MRLGYDGVDWRGSARSSSRARRSRGRSAYRRRAGAAPAGAARAAARPRARALGVLPRADPAGPVSLERVAPLEKAEDDGPLRRDRHRPRLRRDELLRWIEARRRDGYYAGRYRVMTTSGSSGRKGLFVYDRAGWSAIGGEFRARRAGWGWRPGSAAAARDAARRVADPHEHAGAASLGVALPRARAVGDAADRGAGGGAERVPAAALNAYPSAAMRLAEEQEAGTCGCRSPGCRRAASCARRR